MSTNHTTPTPKPPKPVKAWTAVCKTTGNLGTRFHRTKRESRQHWELFDVIIQRFNITPIVSPRRKK